MFLLGAHPSREEMGGWRKGGWGVVGNTSEAPGAMLYGHWMVGMVFQFERRET